MSKFVLLTLLNPRSRNVYISAPGTTQRPQYKPDMDTQTTVYARAVHAQEYSEIDTGPSRLCDYQAPIPMQRLVTNATRKQANDAMSYFRLGNQRISCSQVSLGPFQADAEALCDQRTDPSSDSAQGNSSAAPFGEAEQKCCDHRLQADSPSSHRRRRTYLSVSHRSRWGIWLREIPMCPSSPPRKSNI